MLVTSEQTKKGLKRRSDKPVITGLISGFSLLAEYFKGDALSQ